MLRLTLALLLVTFPASFAATCTSCKSTYDTAVAASGVTPAEECTAAGVYGKCLFTASGDGCDTLTTMVGKINTDVAALSSLPCTLTTTCSCQLAYLLADVSTTTVKCAAVTALDTCATSLSTAGCGDETNANVKTAISGLVTACSGASVVQFSVLSVLAIIAGVFFRN